MQLVVAVVQDEDADLLSKRLNQAGFELTRLRTVGGFLARGNVTILSGIEDEQVPVMLEIIRKTCHTRRRFISPTPAGAEPAHLTLAVPTFPLEVLVGGATVFTFPVCRFVRLPGGSAGYAASEGATTVSDQGAAMNLVLAIVQNEDGEPVTRALIAGGYRVTQINTAGGFLRRGNITLLVGVEPEKVDDVLGVINGACRPRPEAAPPSAKIPASAAIAFVLEASQFIHV